MPFAKKITDNLFEIRVTDKGQWRATYGYIFENRIIILSAFQKKTQKIPKKEILIAIKRFKQF